MAADGLEAKGYLRFSDTRQIKWGFISPYFCQFQHRAGRYCS